MLPPPQSFLIQWCFLRLFSFVTTTDAGNGVSTPQNAGNGPFSCPQMSTNWVFLSSEPWAVLSCSCSGWPVFPTVCRLMFEIPQEMGLIAIAVRQTQGKGQSSFVILSVVLFSKICDSCGQIAHWLHVLVAEKTRVRSERLFSRPENGERRREIDQKTESW